MTEQEMVRGIYESKLMTELSALNMMSKSWLKKTHKAEIIYNGTQKILEELENDNS